jgi:molybdopterin molybdotransferase
MTASNPSEDPAFRAIDEAMALVNPDLPRPPRPTAPPETDDALRLWYAVSGPRTAREASPDTPPRGRDSRDGDGPEHPHREGDGEEGGRPRNGRPGNPRPGTRAERGPGSHRGLPWPEARQLARGAGQVPSSVRKPLAEALGHALAGPLPALTDLPSFDTSAMDGWAVAGPGPWRLSGQLLAGGRPGETLSDGRAVGIATGAALPPGATAVLRREHGRIDADDVLHSTVGAAPPGQDVRPRAQECKAGDELLAAGALVSAAVLGLAAAAGYDELTVVRRPRAEVLILGDELLDRGLPTAGRIRDALGPLLPPWLSALGAEVTAVRRLADDADMLYEAIRGSGADVIVTSGGTAGGPVDFVHPVLDRVGARTLVDGVAVRPGHPMLLAALPSGGHLVGLPGNPLAAVSGVLTLAEPLLRTLGGRPAAMPYAAALTAEVTGHPTDTRLVPVVFEEDSRATPLRFNGPAMLRGIAVADGMAVIPPGGAARVGTEIVVLGTGWNNAQNGTSWSSA